MPPYSTPRRSNLIWSSYLCLGVPSDLLPSDFPTKILWALLHHTCYMPCPSQSSWFHHPNDVLDIKPEDKSFCREWKRAFPDLNLLLIFSRMTFWFVMVVPKYLNCSTVSNDLLPICKFPFYRAFWSRDMTIYLVFSAFISRSITLLTITKASGTFNIIKNNNTVDIWTTNILVPVSYKYHILCTALLLRSYYIPCFVV